MAKPKLKMPTPAAASNALAASSVRELTDPQLGPLAEAAAISDVLNILAVDGLLTAEHTQAVLTRMLRERLADCSRLLETEVQNG